MSHKVICNCKKCCPFPGIPPKPIKKQTFLLHQQIQKDRDEQLTILKWLIEREKELASSSSSSSSLESSIDESDSSSSSSSSSLLSSLFDISQEPALSVNEIRKSMNLNDVIFDRKDIEIGDPPLSSFNVKHIEKLLSIRSRHKAPKSIITDILRYIHEEFKEMPGIQDLPTTWQQCETALKSVKPTFIKVM
jgi:hypothetical protein